MKIIVWGTGKIERTIEQYLLDSVEVDAFVENNEKSFDSCVCLMRKGQYQEIPVVEPEELVQMEYDYILIAAQAYMEISKQCTDILNIKEEKILQVADLGLWDKEQVERIFNINILADRNNYYIGGRHIKMSENHMLPQMQRELKMYDRFVPFLSAITKKKEGKYIIDIGANIGDTLMAMWDHTEDKFLCVEPVDIFLELARKNAEILEESQKRVVFERAFITDNVMVKYVPNISAGGSAVKEIKQNVDTSKEIPSKSLDDLLVEKGIASKEIDLIKIDTDGYDADCIISGEKR